MDARFVALAVVTLATACTPPSVVRVTRQPSEPLSGPREIVIAGERNAIEGMLDDALREHGFKVKRFVNLAEVTGQVGPNTTATVRDPLTRYLIEGSWSVKGRCRDGGFWFRWFKVDVVDLKMNEVVLSASSSEVASEGCWGQLPAPGGSNGRVFATLGEILRDAWESTPAAAEPPSSSQPAKAAQKI